MADELARVHLPKLLASLPYSSQQEATSSGSGSPPGPSPQALVAAVEGFLYGTKRLRVAAAGRSALPKRALLDHPGQAGWGAG
jgi:hypothetical protein